MSVRLNRADIVARLIEREPELRRSGMGSLFLFGSLARDEPRETSDVDLFFDRDGTTPLTLFDLAALRIRLQVLLGVKVDLMTRAGIHPRRRSRIEADAIRVF